MAKPLLTAQTIYDCALELLDEQGAEALNARKLAAALNCSTRTLYQQVGKRDEMIGRLIEHYLAGIQMEFIREATWQESAQNWCKTLRKALLSHPNLFRMMDVEHRAPVAQYVNRLLKVLLQEGFDQELALRVCRVLANITISLSLSEIVAPDNRVRQSRRNKKEIAFEDLIIRRSGRAGAKFQEPPEVFDNAIEWVIRGIG